MIVDNKFRDEKLQYDINRESANISTLSSGKIDKCEYLPGEEILPPHQNRVIEQAKFTYSFLGNALEKQMKKQVYALKSLNLPYKIDELKLFESTFPKKTVKCFDY